MKVHEAFGKSVAPIVVFLFCTTIAMAQEPAKYRITYDCDAQIVTGKSDTYRWTLDIGDKSAVFYNESNRAFNREMVEIRATGDAMALIAQLPALGKKYPAKHDLQIVIGAPLSGKYTYIKQILASKLMYEEDLPVIDWQMTDSTMTICGYECKQAVGSMYGRTWTVWYATDLPLNYGPYVLQGLPGLIMAAKDSEGLFDFIAAGIERAPEGTEVSAYEVDDAQKCSRKRFLEMRSESEGMTQKQMVDRVLNQNSDGRKMTVHAILDENGKEISDQETPKKNFLDKK